MSEGPNCAEQGRLVGHRAGTGQGAGLRARGWAGDRALGGALQTSDKGTADKEIRRTREAQQSKGRAQHATRGHEGQGRA